ncbi:MAG: hypothetical protein AAF829_06155 [Pseudomonadota bacterium]
MFTSSRFAALVLAFAGPALESHAQFVGGVFGPNVDPTDRSAELRVGFLPDAETDTTPIVARLHYQHALGDGLRLRGLIQGRDRGDGDFDYQLIRGEAQWQFIETTPSGYSSALRFDLIIRDDGSDSVGVNWTNQWNLGERWQARAIALTAIGVGDDSFDGVNLQTRIRLAYRFKNGTAIGVINFSNYGNTDAGLGSFDDQDHALGTVVQGRFEGTRWRWWAGALFGISDGAADQEGQLRLSRRF